MTITEKSTSTRSAYLDGNYRPIETEITATDLDVIGELPSDLEGNFVRTGSNPAFEPKGRYHWFDGDGMVHGIEFGNGSATYRNRYVRTEGLAEERAAGEALYTGILERPDFSKAQGPYKDTGNTDLVYHGGKLYALWWLSGAARHLDVPSLDTVGVDDFNGTLDCSISAHAKADPNSGELVFFSHSPLPPYLRYGVASADGRVNHLVDIDLPGPRLQHDIAMTQTRSVLFDMSMMWDPDELAQGKVKLRFFRDVPSRVGIIPRLGTNADVRWFECEPFFMYHTIAAWDEGDEVVLVGCRIAHPMSGGPDDPGDLLPAPTIASLRLEPYLYEWRFDMVTGHTRERQLDDLLTEFTRINDEALAGPARYAYSPIVASEHETLLFDGVVTYDITSGAQLSRYHYPAGWYGGETCFAPATSSRSTPAASDGSSSDGNPTSTENDGYVVTFVANEASGESELYVLDARDVANGPIARLRIPQRVPTGYHSQWVPA